MIEPRPEVTAKPGTNSAVRAPFVAPAVVELGRLKDLTRIGGSL
jgi:hypothetical protein